MFSTLKFAINPGMSLYIPHVFPNFDEEYIAKVFENLGYGYVNRVDLISKMDKNGTNYNVAYVHFSQWDNSIIVENFQSHVTDTEKETRIVHDDPWYWIVLENKTKKHIPKVCKQRINITCESIVTNMMLEEKGELQLDYDYKNEIIAKLERENEELMLELENERHEVINLELKLECKQRQSLNVQYLNYELEEKCCELKEQIDKEIQISCAISEQYEKLVNNHRLTRKKMFEVLDNANARELYFDEQVSYLQNEIENEIENKEEILERGLHFAEQVSELQNELGDKEEIYKFLLKELKTAKDLESLKESVRIFFQDREDEER